RPVIHQGGLGGAKDEAAPQKAMAEGRMRQLSAAPAPMAAMARNEMQRSLGPAAATRELGDLFEYRIAAPVTVRKSESAMLPFLLQKIAARKLLVYSDAGSQHP